MTDTTEDLDLKDPALETKRRKLLRLFAVAVVVIALLWGLWYFFTQAGRVHTDNAYVGADIAQVTPLVSGPVKAVKVGGTQLVQKGDILVELDDADARVDLANAEALLRQAQQRFRQTSAGNSALAARLAARDADMQQAQARLSAARSDLDRATAALKRREALAASGAISAEELTTIRTAYLQAQAGLDQAQAALSASRAMQASAQGDLSANRALTDGVTIADAPDIAAAQARVAQARLALERTIIRAPITGVVTNRQVQIGQRVQAGSPLMTLVPMDAVFVDANFKESQLKHVKPGQRVELTSDFYGSAVVFHGRVKGFAGGTGAAFALIPAQNATGNWVKVVQRLPVRIRLDPAEVKAHPLRVGLSMDAVIDTRD
ncbi:MAG: efflux RND transporter periplasmic adaptor subunit [Chakrabartia sp.]